MLSLIGLKDLTGHVTGDMGVNCIMYLMYCTYIMYVREALYISPATTVPPTNGRCSFQHICEPGLSLRYRKASDSL